MQWKTFLMIFIIIMLVSIHVVALFPDVQYGCTSYLSNAYVSYRTASQWYTTTGTGFFGFSQKADLLNGSYGVVTTLPIAGNAYLSQKGLPNKTFNGDLLRNNASARVYLAPLVIDSNVHDMDDWIGSNSNAAYIDDGRPDR